MHKSLLAVVTLSALALPGCIFAIGGGPDTWEDGVVSSDCCGNCQQMLHAEHRLSTLEHHAKGECKADCSICKPSGAKSDGKADKADAKPATKPATP